MRLVKWIDFLGAHLRALRNAMIAILAVIVLFDVSLSRQEAHYFVDRIYAYWTLFGAVGCFVLIKFAKGMAHMFLSKNEDYYE